jgi:hypothetical protein
MIAKSLRSAKTKIPGTSKVPGILVALDTQPIGSTKVL